MLFKRKRTDTSTNKRPSSFQNFSYYFTEYCNNTSIHGLKFLGERERSPIEKIWWLIFIAISLYFCIILIINIYNKWENSPVIVTFATSQTPIWKIPFPSVTICPEIKSRRDVYNFSENFLWRKNNWDTDQKSSAEFGYMSLVCPTPFEYFKDDNETLFTDESALDFLLKVAPDFDNVFFKCKWLGQNVDTDIFKPVITSEGICYSFNLLNRYELFTDVMDHYKNFGLGDENASLWSLEKGYNKEAELETFPRRTILSGAEGGIDITLQAYKEDLDPLCGGCLHGFKVILHHPGQLPSAGLQYFRVPLDQDVVAAIKPNMMTTSDDLKNYDSEDRQCYFVNEKNLQFFRVYNQQNCLMECLANFTLDLCGCVGFHMPRENSTLICGVASNGCMKDANVGFLATEVKVKLKRSATKKRTKHRKHRQVQQNQDCNCLPSCTSLEFDIETSQSDWAWWTSFEAFGSTHMEDVHLSRLRIFFKDMQFITSERNQLYGMTDFWANCGGLLGLFTGFSFISIVEILYFATLRFICNVRKFGRYYWSGAEELIATKDTLEDQDKKCKAEAVY